MTLRLRPWTPRTKGLASKPPAIKKTRKNKREDLGATPGCWGGEGVLSITFLRGVSGVRRARRGGAGGRGPRGRGVPRAAAQAGQPVIGERGGRGACRERGAEPGCGARGPAVPAPQSAPQRGERGGSKRGAVRCVAAVASTRALAHRRCCTRQLCCVTACPPPCALAHTRACPWLGCVSVCTRGCSCTCARVCTWLCCTCTTPCRCAQHSRAHLAMLYVRVHLPAVLPTHGVHARSRTCSCAACTHHAACAC